MSAYFDIQGYYGCDRCRSAENHHGHNCKHGMLFPLLLIMANAKECPNYEFDREKIKEPLNAARVIDEAFKKTDRIIQSNDRRTQPLY